MDKSKRFAKDETQVNSFTKRVHRLSNDIIIELNREVLNNLPNMKYSALPSRDLINKIETKGSKYVDTLECN